MSGAIAVAGLSARAMAESARRAGFDVLALDALACAAADERFFGWIAGAGFEALPDTLAQGARLARLVGNAPEVVRSVRDPACFFARLDALGVAHPEVAFDRQPAGCGWLIKDAGAAGGAHIRSLDFSAAPLPGEVAGPSRCIADTMAAPYFQRRADGRSLAALFLADGEQAQVVGISEQIVREQAGRPYVFCGAVGPVPLPESVALEVERIVVRIARHLALVGLNSCDFLLDGDDVAVLEINPRPSATMDIYDRAYPQGLVHAHIAASVEGALCEPAVPDGVRGMEYVFAAKRCRATVDTTQRMLALPWCHDIPREGTDVAAGDPWCTVTADAADVTHVHALLAARRRHAQSLAVQHDG